MRLQSALVMLVLLMVPDLSFAGGFGKLPVSARAVTFGGMMVALQDDPNALFVNPASIANLSGLHLSTSYTKLFPGITDDDLNYISGSVVANLGFVGNIGAGVRVFNSNSWTEGELIGSYAQNLFDLISVGGSVKFLYWSAAAPAGRLAVPEPALSSTTLSFDAGAQMRFNNIAPDNDVIVGVSVRDLTQPSIASNKAESGKLNMSYAGGITYVSRSLNYLASIGTTSTQGINRFTVGLEVQAAKGDVMGQSVSFTVRGGGARSIRPIVQDDFFGGIGIETSGFVLDYAFGQPTQIHNLAGTHHVTLRTSF